MQIDFAELRNTYNELIRDTESAKQLDSEKYPESFICRTYVRSFFALIEGMTSQLKRLSHQAHQQKQVFAPGEIEILVEQETFLTDKGEPKSRKKKLKFLHNFQFSIWALNKSLDLDIKLTKEGGWNAMLDAIKIRDRITHPKELNCLSISMDEMTNVVGPAHEWFRDTMLDVLAKIDEQGYRGI